MGQREQNLGSAKVCWHFAYERQQDVFYKQKLSAILHFSMAC